MLSPFEVPNVELTAAQLLRAVNSLIHHRNKPVTHPTLARWRKSFNQPIGPYSWDDAKVYATYGDFLSLGFSADNSKKYTLAKLAGTTNEQPSPEECSSPATTIEATATTIS
jgi:hypothetical protein